MSQTEILLTQPRWIGEAHVETPFPPGIFCVCTAELTRYKDFLVSYRGLLLPKGSGELIQTGPYISENREVAVRAMDQNPQMQWLAFMDDDHKFPPDVMLKHLAVFYEGDFDVLGMLYLTRWPPFAPVGGMFSTRYVDHPTRHLPPIAGLTSDLPWSGAIDGDCLDCTRQIKLRPLAWPDVPAHEKIWTDRGLCLGTAGLLIHRRVLERLTRPIFQIGRLAPHMVHEDIFFSIRCQLLGLKLGMNLDVALGHTGRLTVWPKRTPEGWAVGFEQEMRVEPKPSPGLR